jgi:hypothetical protein
MKRMLCGFVALALLLAWQSQATAAKRPSKIVVFHAAGEFESGYGLIGTVTIETNTGRLVSANLAVVDFGNNIVAVFNGYPSYTNSAGDVEIALVTGTFQSPTGLVLVIPSASLKGYAGGSLVAGESYWSWPSVNQWNQIYHLLDGSLEP